MGHFPCREEEGRDSRYIDSGAGKGRSGYRRRTKRKIPSTVSLLGRKSVLDTISNRDGKRKHASLKKKGKKKPLRHQGGKGSRTLPMRPTLALLKTGRLGAYAS